MNTPSSKEILKQLDLLLNQVGLNKIVSVSLAKWAKGTEYLEFPKNLIEEWKQTVQRSLGISHGKLTIP